MGHLLRNVISTNDKGLIGITTKGEEVALSAPKSNFFISIRTLNYVKETKAKVLQRLKDTEYVRFGTKKNTDRHQVIVPYDVFGQRKV
jgi:hypothetical protein